MKKSKLHLMDQKIKTIKDNIDSGHIFVALEGIRRKYNLNNLELMCIIISMLYAHSVDYKNLISEIVDPSENLSYEHIVKLCNFENDISEIENFEQQLTRLINKLKLLGFTQNSLKIDNKLFKIITRNLNMDINTKGVKIFKAENINDDPLPIRENEAEKIKGTTSEALEIAEEKTVYYYMYGQTGIGKKTLVKRVAKLLEKNLMIIDLKILIDNYADEWVDKFLEMIYENDNSENILCVDKFNILFDKNSKNVNSNDAFSIIELMENNFKLVFVLSDEKIDDSSLEENFFWFAKHIEDLDSTESFKIWKEHMSSIANITDENPEETASKFIFTPKQIKGTIRFAKKAYLENNKEKLNKQQFYRCAYSQVISTLGEKAKLITKKYTWNDLVIDDETKLKLQRACQRITYKHKVYNTWGMGDKLLYGKGLSMIFHGRSGTGKTMAAQIIAGELGLDLYKVDIARVVSKYIGETEKNLKEIFDEAKKSNVILLFDEADSLFSKRTDIKDSHDRNANIEVSFLLQQMEDYEGITILTTNKEQNIDEAFNRRITFKIHFSSLSPGVKGSLNYEKNLKLRKDLWNIFFENGKVPVDKDIDFEYLAEQFEVSGAEIKNIIITSAFLAAAQNSEKVKFKHILEAIKDVTNKQSNDFGKYEYILKNYI